MSVYTIPAGIVGRPRVAPIGSIVKVVPASGASAIVEYTTASESNIKNGVATWTAWPKGQVSAQTLDLASNTVYVRVTAKVGAVELDIDPIPSAESLAAFHSDWGGAGAASSLSGGVALDQLAGMPLVVYGNSYDAADSVNTPGTRTVVQLAAKNRMTLTNNAVSGTMMMDFVAKAIGTAAPFPVANNGLAWICNSINDAARTNPDPADARQQAGYKASLETLIYRISAASVIPETDASFVYSGTWTTNAAANYGSGALQKTAVQGSSVTITTPACTDCALILWGVYNGTQGDYTVTLDGQPFTVLSNPQSGTSPGGGIIVSPYSVAFTGMANTTHTIVVTKTDATANLIYVDDLLILKSTPPLILAEKTCVLQPSGYTFNGGKGTDALVATYNALFDSVIAKVRATYPAARIVVSDPQAAGWDKNSMIGTDGLHPNDYGEYFRRATAEKALSAYLSSVGWVRGINKI